MSEPELRPAVEADLGWLVAAEAEVFGDDAWSEASVRSGLSDTLVVEETGWVVVSVAGGLADLQRIAVLPRRTGLGTRLLAEAVLRATAAGADRLLLEVRADNAAALAFYSGSGFAEIDRRPRYYRDGADAVVMLRPLGPTAADPHGLGG